MQERRKGSGSKREERLREEEMAIRERMRVGQRGIETDLLNKLFGLRCREGRE